jgi:SAM-dependent methyltransferase
MIKNQIVKVVECPICHMGRQYKVWTYSKWQMYRCSQCDVEYSWPFISGDLNYYNNHASYKNIEIETQSGNIPPANLAIADKIKKIILLLLKNNKENTKLKVLDYGCGVGWYAALIKQMGHEVIAVDFNPEMTRIARKLFNINAYVTSLAELKKNANTFNLIICNQVLEHVESPVELLILFEQLLEKNGKLFISVPNRNFIRAKSKLISGKLPEANYPPHHISYWNNNSLDFAMRKAGFSTVVTTIQNYPESMQTENKLKRYFSNNLAKLISKIVDFIGKKLNIQGVHLFTIGSKNG